MRSTGRRWQSGRRQGERFACWTFAWEGWCLVQNCDILHEEGDSWRISKLQGIKLQKGKVSELFSTLTSIKLDLQDFVEDMVQHVSYLHPKRHWWIGTCLQLTRHESHLNTEGNPSLKTDEADLSSSSEMCVCVSCVAKLKTYCKPSLW